ncbi:MAG: glycerate kinase [Pseudomonadota bacterium]
MRVLIAPNAFKESLSAAEVARVTAEAFQAAYPQSLCICVPLADGGDGTVEALLAARGGRRVTHHVIGPLGDRLSAEWALLGSGDVAVIEMAAASGLVRVPSSQRNPRHTTSHGTGELVRHALAHDIRSLILGLGGSATVDGGLGMIQALGGCFMDAAGRKLTTPLTGGDLNRIANLDITGLDPRLRHVRLRVASDVDNPLLGPRGAAAVFGPQKGATPADVRMLEAGLARLHDLMERRLGRSVATRPGAGAAGGAGAALMAFLGAEVEPGARLVLETSDFPQQLQRADLVITGEGRLDHSTLHGKAPAYVARLARDAGIPVLAVCGTCDERARDDLNALFHTILCCPASGEDNRFLPELAMPALAAGLSGFLKRNILPTPSHLRRTPP